MLSLTKFKNFFWYFKEMYVKDPENDDLNMENLEKYPLKRQKTLKKEYKRF